MVWPSHAHFGFHQLEVQTEDMATVAILQEDVGPWVSSWKLLCKHLIPLQEQVTVYPQSEILTATFSELAKKRTFGTCPLSECVCGPF